MRLLKLFILSFTILFLIITAISLLIPFHVRISRATNVLAAPEKVWQQVDDLHTWKNWNPFLSGVSPDSISYSDSVNGKSRSMSMRGTSIQWKDIRPDERIAEMQAGRRSILSGWKCISHTGSDSTTVQWYMDFHLRWYPWEKFASLLFEQSYGPKMEQGLGNLKKITEADRTSIN